MKTQHSPKSNYKNMMDYQSFYLMGIKGVAMTSLAQILLDAGKTVSGCDVAEDFVTAKMLSHLNLKVDAGFTHQLPAEIDCVVYTSAHGGPNNPIVQQARERGLPVFSQAEALAYFFNQKIGIAVCGVGGKSTVSAMITWILAQLDMKPSFSVGVGEILGMKHTGRWQVDSQYFVVEADEYVIDPACGNCNQEPTPRFSFLYPHVTVCTNLEFDHPDVYQSLAQTTLEFSRFFENLQPGGSLIYNHDSPDLIKTVNLMRSKIEEKHISLHSFGANIDVGGEGKAQTQLLSHRVEHQTSLGLIKIADQGYTLELPLPGKFNLLNAVAACLAVQAIGVPFATAAQALKTFQGTQRRFELIGEKDGVLYYDDYAHHPSEVEQTIKALQDWQPGKRQVIAFQPHTFSRTKQLFEEFVAALSTAKELVLLDIFPSAREQFDSSISSKMLAETIAQQNTKTQVTHLKNVKELAQYCQQQLSKGDVLLTMGAGDIYQVHELL